MDKNIKDNESQVCRLDEKRSFFQDLSVEFLVHELKDPLAVAETGVRALLEKADRYGSLSPKQRRTLERVLRSCRKARGMLSDLLEIGRGQAGCFLCNRFSPAEVVLQVLLDVLELEDVQVYDKIMTIENFNARLEQLNDFGIIWEVTPRAGQAIVEQDETKFRQIVANLIKNALRYKRDRMITRLDCEDKCLEICIIDDGPGVAPEHHQLVFQRYRQVTQGQVLSRNGHGLGLAGARVLAQCLGGNLSLESEPGKGAVFRLTLPMIFPG